MFWFFNSSPFLLRSKLGWFVLSLSWSSLVCKLVSIVSKALSCQRRAASLWHGICPFGGLCSQGVAFPGSRGREVGGRSGFVPWGDLQDPVFGTAAWQVGRRSGHHKVLRTCGKYVNKDSNNKQRIMIMNIHENRPQRQVTESSEVCCQKWYLSLTSQK